MAFVVLLQEYFNVTGFNVTKSVYYLLICTYRYVASLLAR